MSDEIKTVEVPDVAEPVAAEVPTRDELKEKGWSASELESAEKRGMIDKKEPAKKEEKQEAPKAEEKEAEPSEPQKQEPKRGSLPDFTFKTPEQEKAFLDAFGPGTPPRAMYFRMKHERERRQALEAERDRAMLEAQMLRDQLPKKQEQPQIDENGQEIDPDDKPLTRRQLLEMQREAQEENERQRKELESKAMRAAEAQKMHEEYARSVYPDFDDALKFAGEIAQKIDILPDEKTRRRALKLMADFKDAVANAADLELDDFNAADIAYEIGRLHPSYGKQANGQAAESPTGNLRPDTKANGGLTPEQMKRIEANTQRRASSASIPGNGAKRTVSVDEITIKDVLKMSADQRDRFRRDHPEKMAQLLRG